MRYYAIADLHGRFDLLGKAFAAIAKDNSEAKEEYTVITLGDYIDRGPQSKEIIELLAQNQAEGMSLICLQGNHEAMAVETLVKPLNADWWMGNGGIATVKSYGVEPRPMRIDPHTTEWSGVSIDQDHVKWMAGLPLYYETPMQVFVHAGIPFSNAALEKQDKEKLTWMLYGKTDHGGWFGDQNANPRITKHIVHGHHQFADGPHEWTHRTDLDTFAWHEGRLVVGVFDDTQGKALRYIEVLGDDYKRSTG